ncbi:hypothetical protein [Sporosarcina ureilytica]|uniref:Uncharacterized protein n=1 Tax=Sporosarcina ureilytica TaxID=298596 RepID=A0A1D8JFT5_9BACL|nr:hypothetical protein [Sporosarcina ureilytica]AOV07571.1 hypothetical protein BI350_08510 [Sporosarcina ureilytica]
MKIDEIDLFVNVMKKTIVDNQLHCFADVTKCEANAKKIATIVSTKMKFASSEIIVETIGVKMFEKSVIAAETAEAAVTSVTSVTLADVGN